MLAQDAESLKSALSLHLALEESQKQADGETKSEAGDGDGSAVPSRGILSQGSAFITETSTSAGVRWLPTDLGEVEKHHSLRERRLRGNRSMLWRLSLAYYF